MQDTAPRYAISQEGTFTMLELALAVFFAGITYRLLTVELGRAA